MIMVNVIFSLFIVLVVFVVGLILVKIFCKIIGCFLVKSGIDKLVDCLNDIDLVVNISIEIKFSVLIFSIVYYIVLFVFIMVVVDVLGMEVILQFMIDMINYMLKVILVFFVFLVGLLFCDFIKKMVQVVCELLGIGFVKLLVNVVFYFLFFNVVLIILKQVELQINFME